MKNQNTENEEEDFLEQRSERVSSNFVSAVETIFFQLGIPEMLILDCD